MGVDNDVNVNSSVSFDLSFFDSENNEYLISSDKNKEFHIWIGRNGLFRMPSYTEINANEYNASKKQIYVAGYQTEGSHISFHAYLNPAALDSGYLVLLKADGYPVLNGTAKEYDHFRILCPQGKSKNEFAFQTRLDRKLNEEILFF